MNKKLLVGTGVLGVLVAGYVWGYWRGVGDHAQELASGRPVHLNLENLQRMPGVNILQLT